MDAKTELCKLYWQVWYEQWGDPDAKRATLNGIRMSLGRVGGLNRDEVSEFIRQGRPVTVEMTFDGS